MGDTDTNYNSLIQSLLVKLIVIQLVKKFPLLKNPEIPYTEKNLPLDLILKELNKFTYLYTVSLRFILILSYLCLVSQAVSLIQVLGLMYI